MSSSMLVSRKPRQLSAGQIRAFVAALIVVAASLPGCADFPRSSNAAGDQKITADVESRLGQHAELEPPNLLQVETINGVVYLNGTVATGLQRDDAALVANQVEGVEKVVNSIAVSR
jgi:osmotically-inducible protein OsmY